MGEWVSYPTFVSPATKRLHPRVEGEMFIGKQIATPANPPTGFDAIYFKPDGNLYRLTPGGTETKITLSGDIVNADINASAGITPDKFNVAHFSAYRSANVTNVSGDGSGYTIIFDTAAISNGAYNPANGYYTAPSAGAYLFTAIINLFSMSSSHTSLHAFLLTTAKAYRTDGDPYEIRDKVSGSSPFTLSHIVPMAAGDTARIHIEVSGGTKTVGVVGGSSIISAFSGKRVA